MTMRQRFPISEVVARTGVPAATIHHYLRLGLIPPPHRATVSRFLYDERHLQGLRLVRALRQRRRLPLPVIRRILPDLLGLEEGEAFRPEMWDQAVGRRAGGSRRSPAARLLDAAVEAFSRRGFGDVNVDHLCRAARMAKGSFYRHHRSKEELFFAAADAAAGEVLEAVRGSLAPGSSRERAAAALADALEPRLTIFLDLLAGAAQRRPGYAAVGRRLLGDIGLRVGQSIGEPDPASAGHDLVQRALTALLWRSLESTAPRQLRSLRLPS